LDFVPKGNSAKSIASSKLSQYRRRRGEGSSHLKLTSQSVNSSMVEAQESMLKAILRNRSTAVK
jgi:hypothetical protein